MNDHPRQSGHPYPVGAMVNHVNQVWADPSWIPTAVVTEVLESRLGGDPHWEYKVRTACDFSTRPSKDNPMTRLSQWSCNAVRLVDDGTPEKISRIDDDATHLAFRRPGRAYQTNCGEIIHSYEARPAQDPAGVALCPACAQVEAA